jgi:hypothetical protein
MKATYLDWTVQWNQTNNPLYPYRATINGQQWDLQINDFPAEPLYTLLIDSQPQVSFDNWPATWQRPTK